jgi:crotonobetainyl-CoA hydratase
MSAAEAERWGLVNEVVPHEKVIECAIRIADKIAANAPLAVAMSKEVLYRGLDAPLDFPPTARAMNQDYVNRIMQSEDAKEGPRAFAEKRQPIWKNC